MATARRDLLLDIQAKSQKKWADEKIFEVSAPRDGASMPRPRGPFPPPPRSHQPTPIVDRSVAARSLFRHPTLTPIPYRPRTRTAGSKPPKFFGNFPYPYMNGMLHLGHAFSLSKLEFASAYHRLKGDEVLFPFAFHCTGMPIKASADKIKNEIAKYGNPPVFPVIDEAAEAEAAAQKAAEAAEAAKNADPTKFAAKKSKAVAKAGTAAYQWEIMKSSGVPESEIPPFADPYHWLDYFPPLAKRDVAAMGCQVDWRRSFITTDHNPFYDAFVRWQFNTLKKIGKIIKAKRMAVYSPLDGQPCADHDRATGEGVGPQEYVLVKMRVYDECLVGELSPLAGRDVFLAAATLRPETMYGQTNCWALPDGDYGAFEMANGDVMVMCDRAARNLAFQEHTKEPGVVNKLLGFKGTALIGCAVKSPLAVLERIYCLPMMTILMNKGTGVVTSVPSDSPMDFMALSDLKAKPALREKFGVKDEWVMPFEVVPCVHIPEFGDACAPIVCEQLKIKSQNEKVKLEEAKGKTYLKGFTDGIMLLGAHKGEPVKLVKQKIRDIMIADGGAIVYSEPEKQVMSRSGDECVVALTDQWYLEYGEDAWRERSEKCLEGMVTYHDEARKAFQHTLGWLRQWACSRAFGLGTRMPWDPQYLIESLSDSTIYMAYYTVAHLLQGGDMYGKSKPSVDPEAMTDDVWDAVFLGTELDADSKFPRDLLDEMRAEFNFWYPFDLRVSGKDLIQNHLTFAIYNHTAIWEGDESKWPRGFRTNGHLLLNGEKMSKSTGNFKTLKTAIEEYSADAMRFALADAGDGIEDANFVHDTANAAILRFTKELEWIESIREASAQGKLRAADSSATFADKVFANAIDTAIARTKDHYENMMFREALKSGYYDLQSARDAYRVQCDGDAGMRADLAARFIEVSTLLIVPFTPHTCEHVWGAILGREGSVTKAGFPVGDAPDPSVAAAGKYLDDLVKTVRGGVAKATAPPKKKPAVPPPPKVCDRVDFFVAEKFGGWQEVCLGILADVYGADGTFPPVSDILEKVKASPLAQEADFKNVMKMVMPFVKFKMNEAAVAGRDALGVRLIFDEAGVLRENAEYVARVCGLKEVGVFAADADSPEKAAAVKGGVKVDQATPGSPGVNFVVTELSVEGVTI